MGQICEGCSVLYDNNPFFDLQVYILISLILLPLLIGIYKLFRG